MNAITKRPDPNRYVQQFADAANAGTLEEAIRAELVRFDQSPDDYAAQAGMLKALFCQLASEVAR